MRHGSLFSGIGGFDLAAEWMGWENVFHCEWNNFGQKVLEHYWPNAISYTDITKTDFSIHRGSIDILSGGFPCQPYSAAGKRLGTEDNRHLWPEMLRAVREIQPSYVVGENVRGLTNWNGGLVFDQVQADLEAEGYEVLPFLLPACAVNAPHRRDRIWFVAKNTLQNGRRSDERKGESNIRKFGDISTGDNEQIQANDGEIGATPDTDSGRQSSQEHRQKKSGWFTEACCRNDWQNFPTQSPVCGRDDGLPDRLDGITFPKWQNESIKAYGNAIVPQVAYQIFKSINKIK